MLTVIPDVFGPSRIKFPLIFKVFPLRFKLVFVAVELFCKVKLPLIKVVWERVHSESIKVIVFMVTVSGLLMCIARKGD